MIPAKNCGNGSGNSWPDNSTRIRLGWMLCSWPIMEQYVSMVRTYLVVEVDRMVLSMYLWVVCGIVPVS